MGLGTGESGRWLFLMVASYPVSDVVVLVEILWAIGLAATLNFSNCLILARTYLPLEGSVQEF
jgi:hypothetical protein